MIRIVVVDDHPLIVDGLTLHLEATQRFQVVGRGLTGRQALDLCNKCQPDILLLDLMLPDMSGVEVIRTLRRNNPAVRVVVLSGNDSQLQISLCMANGASAYIFKSSRYEVVQNAIEHAVRNTSYLDPSLADLEVTQYLALSRDGSAQSEAVALPKPEITLKEAVVLEMLASNYGTSETIAQKLCVSKATVDKHVASLRSKLGANNRLALVQQAQKLGLIKPPLL
jgi:DNA-binding NarL/FixJ family response regulator